MPKCDFNKVALFLRTTPDGCFWMKLLSLMKSLKWGKYGIYLWTPILREKCPNTEFFLVRAFPHSDWIKIRTRESSVFGHFSRSGSLFFIIWKDRNSISNILLSVVSIKILRSVKVLFSVWSDLSNLISLNNIMGRKTRES